MAKTEKQWTLDEIVTDWLIHHGYDGLCYLEDAQSCGCGFDDLMPCIGNGDPPCDCRPAYAYEKGDYGPNKKFRKESRNEKRIPHQIPMYAQERNVPPRMSTQQTSPEKETLP
jgi:hypothetical protein